MTDVLDATYVNFIPMKNGQVKIILETPRHKLQKILDVLGPPPDAGETKWVAVALLDPSKIENAETETAQDS